MSHPAPQVYIDNILMDSYSTDNAPVLGGLQITFGVDTDMDMQGVETCSLQMLIKEPQSLDFLDNGKTIVIYHGGTDPFTYWAGRIQRLSAAPDANVKGALRITINASDLTADLQNQVVYGISNAQVDGLGRYNALSFWAPDDWEVNTWGIRWPERIHSAVVKKSIGFLELMDKFLRAQIMIRANTTMYTPGVGLNKRLTLMQDGSATVAADKLGKYMDGRWGSNPGVPSNMEAFRLLLSGSNVLADAGWTKEPEDVITEVSLQRLDPTNGLADSENTPITSRNYVDTTAIRNTYGMRSVEFETDLRAGGPTSEILPIFDHWIQTKSGWRTKTVTIQDTDRMTFDNLRYFLDPQYRFRAYLVIRNLMLNRPDYENTDIRGFIIGGQAVWTGTKWELQLTLGRVPALPDDGDYWTCDLIAGFPYFADGQCDTVGDDLTCTDFLRIGAP